MRRNVHLVLGLLAVAAAGCFRANIQTHEIHVPEMSDDRVAERLAWHLTYTTDTSAVQRVEADLDRRVLIVTYDSRQTARKNLEHLISAQGFTANDLPPRVASTIPAPTPRPDPPPETLPE
jgi:hypothetical protein